LGHCAHPPAGKWFQPEWDTGHRARNVAERNIIILLAGGMAEAKRRGRNHHRVRCGDLTSAFELASCFSGSAQEASAYLGWLAARAEALIHDRDIWNAVQALAGALLAKRTIGGREAQRLYLGAYHGLLAEEEPNPKAKPPARRRNE